MKHALLLASFFVFVYGSFDGLSQSGFLHFKVAPPGSVIKIGEEYFDSKGVYPRDTGTYVVELWAPKHEYIRYDVVVKTGETAYVVLGLPHSEEWKSYKMDLHLYHAAKFGLRYATTAVYLAYLGSSVQRTVENNRKIDDLYARAMVQKEGYENSVGREEVQASYDEYYLFKTEYDQLVQRHVRRRNLDIGINIVGAFALAGSYYLSTRLEKPIFREEVKLSFSPSLINEQFVAGLSLNVALNAN